MKKMKNFQNQSQFLLGALFLFCSVALIAQNPPETVYFKGKKSTAAYPVDAGKYTINNGVKDGRGCACYDHESGKFSLRRVEALAIKWYIFSGTCEKPTEAIIYQNGDILSAATAYNGVGCNPVVNAPQYFSLTPYSSQKAVTLYSQSNYGGTSISLEAGEYDLTSGQYLPFNDKTNSIKVAAGYTVQLFTEWQYKGQSKTTNSDIAALDGAFKGSVSSIKITKATTGKTHVSFSGAQQFIEVSGTNLAQGNAARTVYAWVKTNQTSIGNIISWGTRSRIQRNGFAVRDGKAAFIGEWADYTGTIKINDGKWHHIAMVYDGATMSIYVDGKSAGSRALGLSTKGQNLRLGNVSSPANAEFFNGDLKAVKIWNEALAPSEITSSGISTSKKATFNYDASQPVPSNFKLNNMTEAANWK
jgi:hypothetical protein